MKEFLLQRGMLVVAEVKILRHQRCPPFSLQSQSKHGESAGHHAEFFCEILVELIFPHGQTDIPFYGRVQIRVLHGAGKKLVDSLLGQTGNRQIDFVLSTEIH